MAIQHNHPYEYSARDSDNCPKCRLEWYAEELPEKLELRCHSTIYADDEMMGTFFDIGVEEEKDNPLAAEIVRRYNAFADQQDVIKQLADACQKIIIADNSGKGPDWRDALDSCQTALAAAGKPQKE